MPTTTNNTAADDASVATTVTEASQKGKATEESPDYKSANEDITMVDSHGEEEEEVDKVTNLVDLPADTCFLWMIIVQLHVRFLTILAQNGRTRKARICLLPRRQKKHAMTWHMSNLVAGHLMG